MADDADTFSCMLSGMKLSSGVNGLIAMAAYARQLAQHLRTEHGEEPELPYRTRISMSETASEFAAPLLENSAKLERCGMPGTEVREMRQFAAKLVDDIRIGNVADMETDAKDFNSYMVNKFRTTPGLFETSMPIEM